MKKTEHIWKDGIEGKKCSKCREWRPLEQYRNTTITSDGKTSWCKPCNKKYRAAHYIKNREMLLACQRDYLNDHPRYWARPTQRAARIEGVKRRRARTKSFEAIKVNEWLDTLTLFDNKCAYCGKDSELTQDHIIPVSKGGKHTVDNLIPACKGCNASKLNKGFLPWYKEQRFFDSDRLELIQSIVKGGLNE